MGFMPKSGIKPKVSCAGLHLRAPSMVVHLKTAPWAVTMEQQITARPSRRSMIVASKRDRKRSK